MTRPRTGRSIAVIAVDRLERSEPVAIDLRPEPEVVDTMIREFALAALDDLAFSGELAPHGARGWRLTGRLSAKVEQSCVVTLEPVITRIDDAVDRTWLPAADIDPEEEVLDPDGPDAPEPLGETIDLIAVIHEALALAIDPYPRARGAELKTRVFGPSGTEPMTDEAARPFAQLAALRGRLSDRDDGG